MPATSLWQQELQISGNEKQQIQIENMVQDLLHAHKKLFGPSTEATKQTEGQLFLFEEAQRLAEELGVEQKKITVRPYIRTPRKPGIRAEMLASLQKRLPCTGPMSADTGLFFSHR